MKEQNERNTRVMAKNEAGKYFLEMSPEERAEFLQEVEQAARDRWQRERAKHADVIAQAERIVKAGGRLNYEEFYLLTGVKISAGMEGKMLGVDSLSTSCIVNPMCLGRLENGVGICAECFSGAKTWNVGLLQNTVLNYRILTEQIIPVEYWPMWQTDQGRIESFGDLGSVIQAINYINLCKANPATSWGWWTKNPWFISRAIKAGYSKPANCTMILSAQFLDGQGPKDAEKTLLQMYPFLDKVFSVFSLRYLRETLKLTAQEIAQYINCGGRSCRGCGKCYRDGQTSPAQINELRKADVKKLAKLLAQAGQEWED